MTLFEPLTLGGLTIRNRVMMSPMSQHAAGPDGRAGDWHLVHYGSRAVGGCGLIMVEDTAVARIGRTSSSALGLYESAQAQALCSVVRFCQRQGASVGLQLAHAGRKALSDRRGEEGTIAPSPLAFGPGWRPPREVHRDELGEVVAAFVHAAELALEAGIDAVEVHAGHGYLLHQFLSPLTNRRPDEYGVDPVGRRKLLLEVVSAVRACWPQERALFVRLPAGDGEPDGLTGAEVIDCAAACAALGADLIDVTEGTPLLGGKRALATDVLTVGSALIESRLPVALGGGVLDGADAERLADEIGASLVSVGRPLLGDPYWTLRAARELGATPPYPSAYAQALG